MTTLETRDRSIETRCGKNSPDWQSPGGRLRTAAWQADLVGCATVEEIGGPRSRGEIALAAASQYAPIEKRDTRRVPFLPGCTVAPAAAVFN